MRGRFRGFFLGAVLGVGALSSGEVVLAHSQGPQDIAQDLGSSLASDFSIKDLLGKVEAYLNGFRSLHAHFKQEDPDGTVRFGELYIQKPGLMRIAYRGLKGLLIVSDGTWLSYDDKALEQVSYVPLHTTPAALILKDKFEFKETIVEKVEFMPNHELQITMRNKQEPDAGSLTLVLKQNPIELAGWQVMDPSAQMTIVELSHVEVEGKAPDGSFELSGPKS